MPAEKAIKTPEAMYSLFEEYKTKVKENPRIAHEFHGKDAIECKKKLEAPLTMAGFEVHGYNKGFTLSNYFEDKHKSYKDFYGICTRIKKEIREDQIMGGMTGQYNSSITQRLNNLKETTETNINQNVKILNIDPLDDSQD